jgi:hypothetical protein
MKFCPSFEAQSEPTPGFCSRRPEPGPSARCARHQQAHIRRASEKRTKSLVADADQRVGRHALDVAAHLGDPRLHWGVAAALATRFVSQVPRKDGRVRRVLAAVDGVDAVGQERDVVLVDLLDRWRAEEVGMARGAAPVDVAVNTAHLVPVIGDDPDQFQAPLVRLIHHKVHAVQDFLVVLARRRLHLPSLRDGMRPDAHDLHAGSDALVHNVHNVLLALLWSGAKWRRRGVAAQFHNLPHVPAREDELLALGADHEATILVQCEPQTGRGERKAAPLRTWMRTYESGRPVLPGGAAAAW